MPANTPNFSLPYPLLTDAADIEDFGVKDLAVAIDGTFAPPSQWNTVLEVNARTSGAPVITTTPSWFTSAGETTVSGGSVASGAQGIWAPPTAGDIAVTGKTTRLRIRVVYLVNSTAPGITITWGLYPITGISGSFNQLSLVLGTAIAGSTVSVVTPAGPSGSTVTGASFDFSAVTGANTYAIGIVGNGTANANSLVSTNAFLEKRNT